MSTESSTDQPEIDTANTVNKEKVKVDEVMSLFADFTPVATSHSRRSESLITTTNPIVASILLRSFPLIIFINSALDLITWSSREPFLNFLYNVALYLIIYYYDSVIFYWYLTPLIVLIYGSLNYYINSVYIDVNYDSPTLEEVVDTLENFTIRMDIILNPLRSINISYKKLSNLLFISTPFHILMLKWFMRPKVYVLIWIIVITSFHSLWFQATIKILWRSQLIRNIFNFFVGSQTSSSLNSYKIIKESPSKTGKIIQFQIFEHERRWFGIGWSDKLLPYERSSYTNEALQVTTPPNEFSFPFNSKHWQWLEESWKIDLDYCKNKNKDGWVYFDNYWKNAQYTDSITAYTRTRIWTRKAVLVTEKKN